jgi:acetyltransferase
MMAETRIYRHLQTQEVYAEALRRLEEILVRFSQLVIDFPHFREIDINPFFFTPTGGFAVDSRMVLEESVLEEAVTSKEDLCPAHLSICPYPERYVKELVLRDGTPVVIRPIRPEDEPLIGDVMKGLSEESFAYRFCQQVVEMSHERLVRYCQVDYDRELAFVAVTFDADGNERLVGDVRVIKQPDLENAEVAILVIDTWQGKGLGRTLMEYCLQVSREIGLKAVWMEILKENTRMLHLAKIFGFKRAYSDEDMIKVVLEIL